MPKVTTWQQLTTDGKTDAWQKEELQSYRLAASEPEMSLQELVESLWMWMLQYGRLAERTRDAKSDAVTMDAENYQLAVVTMDGKSDCLAAVTKEKLLAGRRVQGCHKVTTRWQ
jgi:hypothetical protein